MGWYILVLAPLAIALPLGVGATQLLQPPDATTCPAEFVDDSGPLEVRPVLATEAQRAAFDAEALEAYLADRLGRDALVMEPVVRDHAGYLAMAQRAVRVEILAYFADAAMFRVLTSEGMGDALGYSRQGEACAVVSFVPSEPRTCILDGAEVAVQPAYAYLAHEIGHVFGLRHTEQGLMGVGVYRACATDTFDESQQAQLRADAR